ncbi:MAG: mandelate racemase/muconate lactonizing enzyme family protein [Bacteroidota bacterium]
MISRKEFLARSAGLPTLGLLPFSEANIKDAQDNLVDQLKGVARQPVLKAALVKDSVFLQSLTIHQSGKHYFLKATSIQGTSGYAVMRDKYIRNIYPIMLNRIIPFYIGKDARKLEALQDNLYVHQLNYKWQGLAFWVGVAYVELALLDLLGKHAGVPVSDLLGGRIRTSVDIYYASGNRGNAAEEEIEHLQELIGLSGAHAVKYRLGARMAFNSASDKRDRALIPLVRKVLGDEVTIYADANGSFTVEKAIETGQQLEEHGTAFFEEPCPFDHYEETRAVSEALSIPIAGGEEETSMRRFIWLLASGTLQVVQPDLLFFGGLIRSIKVARMANLVGIPCTPHISGGALGFLYMMQFSSCVPNIGPYQEFKGNNDGVPVASDVELIPANGTIQIPTLPGLGITFDPDFLLNTTPITSI